MTRRGLADWTLAAEALVLLALFRIALAAMPVRRIIKTIAQERPARTGLDSHVVRIVRRVQWAGSAAARHSPVEFVCFPQALAGYTMLRRRGVPSTLIYGVARSGKGELLAHTWLEAGDKIVLGGDAAPEFTEVERWS